jgi:hypothetical protein
MESKTAFQVFSISELDGRVREYKKRKLHEKTKSGCQTCKVKKVKVRGDECLAVAKHKTNT